MPALSRRPRPGSLADWKSRFKSQLSEKFLIRLHMAVMLTVVTVVGMFASGFLARAGVDSLALRYPLAVLVAYVAFFGTVRLWISWVHEEAPPSLREPALAATLLTASAMAQRGPSRPGATVERVADAVDVALDGADGADAGFDLVGGAASGADEGAVVVLGVLLLVAAFAAGAWLVWEAPAILAEAAFGAVLAGALRRARRHAHGPHWAWSVFKRTAVAFALVAFFASLAGFGAQEVCPQARNLKRALSCSELSPES